MPAKKLIERLTPGQEMRLPFFREEWRSIGLATGPVDRARVEPVLVRMYEVIGRPAVPLIILPSPASSVLAIPILALVLRGQIGDQLGDQLGGQLWGQLRDQLWDQLWDQLGNQLRGQLRDQLWDQLGNQLWGQLGGQLGDQLAKELPTWWYGFGGSIEAFWIAFYRFCEEIGVAYGAQHRERLGWYEELARHCGWWWPYGRVVIASDRPTRTQWNAAHRMHCQDGPAIEFSDGYALYALNGVRVPKELVMTPGEDLDPQAWILKQANAEVRREAVRKIGIERVCERLGAKVIDSQGDMYELLLLDLGDQRRRPYLKMRNPSIGVFHIEGVHPDCRTVETALKWRNGTETPPTMLT